MSWGLPAWASDLPERDDFLTRVYSLAEDRWLPPSPSVEAAAVLVYAWPRATPDAPVWVWKTRGGHRGDGASWVEAQIRASGAARREQR